MDRRSFIKVGLLIGGGVLVNGCGTSIRQTWDPAMDHPMPAGGCGRGLRRRARLINRVPRDQQLRWMQEDLTKALTKPMTERQWILLVNSAGCMGCAGCDVGCPTEQAKVDGIGNRENVNAVAPGFRHTLMAQGMCGQCTDTRCVASCDSGAMKQRPDGIVTIDQASCSGCGTCVTACSSGGCSLVNVDGRKVATKCDLCVDLVDAGELPRCVTTCSKGHVYFGDLSLEDSFVSQVLGTETRLALQRRFIVLA